MSGDVSLAAVVLAAGASSRMGQAKALLQLDGATFVRRCIDGALRVGADPVVVVGGAVDLRPFVPAPACYLHHEGWAAGPLSSLQTGLKEALARSPTGVLVLTVDRPHVQPQTLQGLVEAFQRAPQRFWQPCWQGRRGHPVLYPQAVARRVLTLSADQTPRVVLDALEPSARGSLNVDDAAVRDNIDTPEDLARLRAAHRGS